MRKLHLQRTVSALICGILLLHPFLCASAEEDTPAALQYADIPVTDFRVTGVIPQEDDCFGTLSWWYSEWEDCRYLFLPATADRSKLTISYESDHDGILILNNRPVFSEAQTDVLSTGDTFSIVLNDVDCGELRVMQSDRASIWFSLEDGALETLAHSKSQPVTGSALMLNADGSVEYQGALERLKGRGNSSWDYSIKKPYNFKLPKKTKLYGMGGAKKWALLSNFLDHSMLRNEIAFAMSRQAGLDFTPDAVFVDLYIDGGYCGTYQLAERVHVHKQRVNIRDLLEETEAVNPLPPEEYPAAVIGGTVQGEEPGSYQYYEIPNDPADITGGYLIQFQLRGRSEHGEFITDRGQICDMIAPEYASKAQTEYIRAFMQELEDAIYSETGYNEKGKHYSDYLDVDSLLLGCLVQEVTENADGCATSFYLYKDSDSRGDGKLHYGPVWDFDLAFCNYSIVQTDQDGKQYYAALPDNLYAIYTNNLIETLWRKDEIVRRAAVLYEEHFDSFVTALTEPEQPEASLIAQMAADLSASAEMNRVRWHMYGGRPYKPLGPVNGETYAECTEYVRSFLARRQAFLQKEYLRLSRESCIRTLETTLSAFPRADYDPPEQAQLDTLQNDTAAALAEAETAASAEKILAEALAEFDTIPKSELSGDFNVNGSVSLDDAQAVLLYVTQEMGGLHPQANVTAKRNGDVDKNGRIDLADVQHILRHYTMKMGGQDYVLPVVNPEKEPAQEASA
ncbi:MAG: CotH kinase family protein [Oscillospiraceae bacterium]|nr:CotH kinase family protein [Oscillospiraceae bacterium]